MSQHHPLYKRMRRLGVSLQDIADATGRTKSAIQKQLNSGREPDEYVVEAIERALAAAISSPPPGTVPQFKKDIARWLKQAEEIRVMMRMLGIATLDELVQELKEIDSRS